MRISGQDKFELLRKDYPFLSYEGFDVTHNSDGLSVEYRFNLANTHFFHPKFFIPVKAFLKDRLNQRYIESEGIRSLLFHIGMIELISYWKAACPPLILVRTYHLEPEQIEFWKSVYFNGLGEFFYTNGINTDIQSFVEIRTDQSSFRKTGFNLEDSILVPIGGGKDSVVTLELLNTEFEIRPFILNPRGASLETCFKAGFSNTMIAEINRSLDPLLLKLNNEGFLNGHTPFSALLAFYTLLMAAFTGQRHIALSNESSANEPTVAGTHVNHQYSKSYQFEKIFRDYVCTYISEDFNYFSFLRPLNELQIGMLFSRFVRYYPVFKSCNAGSKTDSWCGSCPKCLFAWIILSPFIPLNELTLIFGKNLYEDASLIRYLRELTGIDEVKPFECVGTVEEVNAALQLYIQHHNKEKLPILIDYYSNTSLFPDYRSHNPAKLLSQTDPQHFLDERFHSIISKAISWKS